MSDRVIPPRISGTVVDPPPRNEAHTVARIDNRSHLAGVGFRAFLRFSQVRATLLAAGTAYYVFLSLFALIALAFGVAVRIGSGELTRRVTEALDTAFPTLVGPSGLDPADLQTFASGVSIVGLVVLVYSGGGAMTAASSSLHLIYGAPRDPRNYVVAKARLIGWMLLFAPLILVSFAPSIVVTTFAQPVIEFVGLPESFGRAVLLAVSLVVSFAVNVLVLWLLLGRFGGVRPEPMPRLTGALLGAVLIEALKYLMATIVAWAVSRPQYGAFAAPVAVLFVLYLLCLVVYGCASLTAALAEPETASAPTPEEGHNP